MRLIQDIFILCFVLLGICHARADGTPGAGEICGLNCNDPLDGKEVQCGMNTEAFHKDASQRRNISMKLPMIDSNNNQVDPCAFPGEVVLVSFFYTTCQTPNKCPAVIHNFEQLQKALKEAKLYNKVRLCLVTLNPRYDTPARLKEFGKDQKLTLDERFRLLCPPILPGGPSVYNQFGVPVSFNGAGVAMHGVHLVLLDSRARVAGHFSTVLWDPAKVIKTVSKLLDEAPALLDGTGSTKQTTQVTRDQAQR